MNPVLVAGTSSWKNDNRIDWYWPGHAFGEFLVEQGVSPLFDGDKPFIWSTELSGIPMFSKNSKSDWAAGAAALAYYVIAMKDRRAGETAIIAHSHALQVTAYAAAIHGLKINTLITVGSPIRKDMSLAYERLRANTKYWLHLYSDWSDRWQWFGELFDGHLGIVRQHPLADENVCTPGVGHSDLLRERDRYHLWKEKLWIDKLQSVVQEGLTNVTT